MILDWVNEVREKNQTLYRDTFFEHFQESYTIAGIPFTFHYADARIRDIFSQSIAHLQSFPIQDCYHVYLWDSIEHFPPCPFNLEDFEITGGLNSAPGPEVQVAYFSHAKLLNLFLPGEKTAFFILQSLEDIPAFEMACPFRALFYWILKHENKQMIHAGAISANDKALIIAGLSGSGKSTTCIKALLEGMDYLGDDLTGFEISGQTPWVYSLYNSGKMLKNPQVKMDALADFSSLSRGHEKDMFFFHPELSDRLRPKSRVKALLLPEIGGTLGLTPIPLARALSMISDSTRQLIPYAGHEISLYLLKLFKLIPVFKLNLGQDPSQIIPFLTHYLDD